VCKKLNKKDLRNSPQRIDDGITTWIRCEFAITGGGFMHRGGIDKYIFGESSVHAVIGSSRCDCARIRYRICCPMEVS